MQLFSGSNLIGSYFQSTDMMCAWCISALGIHPQGHVRIFIMMMMMMILMIVMTVIMIIIIINLIYMVQLDSNISSQHFIWSYSIHKSIIHMHDHT